MSLGALSRQSYFDVDLQLSENQAPALVTTPVPNPEHKQETAHATRTGGQWLQRLVEINVQLFNHANQPTSEPPPETSPNPIPEAHQKAHGNYFDQTLVLSLQFLEALRAIAARPPATPSPSLDPGTLLIICSCYIRVLELFAARLGPIRGALSANTTAAATAMPELDLPTLAACSHSLEGYPVMRLRVALELVEELLESMAPLLLAIVGGTCAGRRSRQGGEADGERHAVSWRVQELMPGISQEGLMGREDAVYQIIREIRRELKSSRRVLI